MGILSKTFQRMQDMQELKNPPKISHKFKIKPVKVKYNLSTEELRLMLDHFSELRKE